MHVVIITEGTQIFECETDYLNGEAKEKANKYVRNAVDTLDYVFWKNDVSVLNSFDDRKHWDDGSPETRARLDNFKSRMQLVNPSDKITMGGAIDFAIAQAERVPKLERKIKELQEEVDTLNAVTSDMSLQCRKNVKVELKEAEK